MKRPLNPDAKRRSPALPPWLWGVLLTGAILLAYQPAWHAGFIWDDDLYVTQNKLLTAPDGLRRIWFSLDSPSQYFPLVYTTFRIERVLWGLNPAGYHWVNILLHAANALILWRLLNRLELPGAWLAAALFALHPVQVESVAWITERKNVLCLFFFLLALRAWIEFVDDRNPASPSWKFYGLCLLCYALALFSKTTACTLPVALLLVLWLKRRPIDRARLLQMIPFVAVGLAMGLVTVWWEQHHQGVKANAFGLGWLERILIAGRALWFYAGKLVWPVNLTFTYPRWRVNPADPMAYLGLVGAIGLAVVIYLTRRRAGRSVATAFLFYVATLSPLLGFVMLATFRYSFVADHYQYIASIGPLALVAAGITGWFGRSRNASAFAGPLLCVALLTTLGILTWRQAATYVDPETLWRVTIARNPASFMARNNLANLLLADGRTDEAILHYRQALEIQPDADAAAYNLANALFNRGEVDEAIVNYRKALELQPEGAAIWFRLGNAFAARNQLDDAIGCYRKAWQLQPASAAVAGGLGKALLAQGKADEALDYLRRAVEFAPGLARAHSDLANALVRKGSLREAMAQYEAALALQPDNIPCLANLAWMLATCPDPALRNGAHGVELAQRANELGGGKSPQVLRTLSAAYAEAGRFPEAIAAVQQALAMPGVQADTAYAGQLLAQLQRYEAQSAWRDSSLTNAAPEAGRK
jgi:tetratricopeptide (TPR) repeat protein